jgi:hypothetical protein
LQISTEQLHRELNSRFSTDSLNGEETFLATTLTMRAIIQFDFPYIARRMVSLVGITKKLNLFGKKPWEIPHLGYDGVVDLEIINITSKVIDAHFRYRIPKDDIDGS